MRWLVAQAEGVWSPQVHQFFGVEHHRGVMVRASGMVPVAESATSLEVFYNSTGWLYCYTGSSAVCTAYARQGSPSEYALPHAHPSWAGVV